jgi:hypothetical protein
VPTFLLQRIRREYTLQMLTAFAACPGKGAYNNPGSLEQAFFRGRVGENFRVAGAGVIFASDPHKGREVIMAPPCPEDGDREAGRERWV